MAVQAPEPMLSRQSMTFKVLPFPEETTKHPVSVTLLKVLQHSLMPVNTKSVNSSSSPMQVLVNMPKVIGPMVTWQDLLRSRKNPIMISTSEQSLSTKNVNSSVVDDDITRIAPISVPWKPLTVSQPPTTTKFKYFAHQSLVLTTVAPTSTTAD